MQLGWFLWGCILSYIALQDFLHHAFSLWTVVVLSLLTVYLNPSSWRAMLVYFIVLGIVKYGIEWWKQKPCFGIGDVEILSILCSQTEHVEWFLIFSGVLGVLYCILFKKAGLAFVPVMGITWCIVEGVHCIW